jgi:hypothetical protein
MDTGPRYTFDKDTTVEGPDGIPYQYKAGDSVAYSEALRLGLVKEERAKGAAPENRAEAAPAKAEDKK